MASDLRAGVVIATAGRPALAAEVMADVDRQTVPAAVRILSVPNEASLPEDTAGWQVVFHTGGLAAQRNAGMKMLEPAAEIAVFFDDDSVVRPDYLENAIRWFAADPYLVGLHGKVLRDGAVSGEISRADAERELARSASVTVDPALGPSRTLYGCNMAIRRDQVERLYFDERLPAYSWLEDHDLARRLMRTGSLGRANDCIIVHRAAQSGGRSNHRRLGYSQVMNPAYLRWKGSFPLWLMVWEIFRPSVKNVMKSAFGRETRWRRVRLRGNLLAWSDIVRGRYTPERILKL